MTTSPTTVTQLTATGRSAIAVIAVRGPLATEAIERFFDPMAGGSLEVRAVGRVLFGDWLRDDATAGEGVVVRRVAEHAWEVHPHGGTAAARAIIADLVGVGCQQTDWQTAYREQSPDPLITAATLALTRATTKHAAAHLLAQRGGALRGALRQIEEHVAAKQFSAALAGMHELLENSGWGLHLTEPWKVTLCGSPNVGKSSLINALLGYSRAIVFDAPGTTRDVLTARTAIEGWPVELADTAGIRTSHDALEAAGISRSRAALAEADLVIPVLDASQPLTADDRDLLTLVDSTLVIANKADLALLEECNEIASPRVEVVATSALTGAGMADLLAAIAQRLVPQEPPVGAPALFTVPQVEALQQAIAACQQEKQAEAGKCLRRVGQV